jgi:hypothetical protein
LSRNSCCTNGTPSPWAAPVRHGAGHHTFRSPQFRGYRHTGRPRENRS